VTITVSNTNANSITTVGQFRGRVNELATAMTTKVVTTDSNAASGNAAITGTFESSVLVANSIGGGNTSVSNTLFLTTVASFSLNAIFNSHVHLGAAANVHVLAGNATYRFLVTNSGGVSGLAAIRPNTGDIDDFLITSPDDGAVLAWQNSIGKWVDSNTIGLANNATNLGGNPASYYTNATNLATGTVNPSRVAGNYTGITNVGTLGVLSVTGNVTIASGRLGIKNSAPSVSLHITDTDAIQTPVGNTGQRPAGANGMFRYNSETGAFEGYIGGSWGNVSSFVGGTLTSPLVVGTSNATTAFLNVPHGSTNPPSGAVNGDFWTTTAGAFIRIGGSNKSLAFLEGGTYTGNVTFNSNVTAQNVGGNYFTVSTIESPTHYAGNSTVNAVMNSSTVVIQNSTAAGTLSISSLTDEFIMGVITGEMPDHLFPITIINYVPFAATITDVKFMCSNGSFSGSLRIANSSGGNVRDVNNCSAVSISTTIADKVPAANNALVEGDRLLLTTTSGVGTGDWNWSFFIKLSK
jgi:hypothetical protein